MAEPISWKLDRSSLTVASLHEDPGDKQYWLSKTPRERLEAMDLS
jgi:hypothetical protein